MELMQLVNDGRLKRLSDFIVSKVPAISSGMYDSMELKTAIMTEVLKFLECNSDNEAQKNNAIAESFTNHISRTRLDWKPQDIAALFNFITDRKDIQCNRMFGNKIMLSHLITCVDAYENERSEAREHAHRLYKVQENKLNDGAYLAENPHFKEIIERLTKKPAEITVTVNEDLTREQLMMKEFDRLFYESGKVSYGIRYIEIDGTTISQEDYLKHYEL